MGLYQAELVQAHAVALHVKETKELESNKQWSEALVHEREKRDRTYDIQAAQFARDVQVAERKIDREWKTITETLQRQVGLEQTRIADMSIQSDKDQRTFTDTVLRLERLLAKEQGERQKQLDATEV